MNKHIEIVSKKLVLFAIQITLDNTFSAFIVKYTVFLWELVSLDIVEVGMLELSIRLLFYI